MHVSWITAEVVVVPPILHLGVPIGEAPVLESQRLNFHSYCLLSAPRSARAPCRSRPARMRGSLQSKRSGYFHCRQYVDRFDHTAKLAKTALDATYIHWNVV